MTDRVLNPLRSDDLRFQVLRLLEQKADMAQGGLVAVLDISVGWINYCLHTLIERGLMKAANFRNKRA